MSAKDIDPALDLTGAFAGLTGNTTRHVERLRREAIFSEGVVPARFKTLGALLWSVSARCEPCLVFYARQAARLGASEAELGEMLAVAAAMGGCVGEMWALKAFKAFRDHTRGAAGPGEEPGCCHAPAGIATT